MRPKNFGYYHRDNSYRDRPNYHRNHSPHYGANNPQRHRPHNFDSPRQQKPPIKREKEKPSEVSFPELPTKREVFDEIEKVTNEIRELSNTICSLQKEKSKTIAEILGQSNDFSPNNIDTYRGFKIDQNLFNQFMKDNKKHITQSHINSQVPSKIKYQRIFDLPQYQDMFSIHDENLSVFYSTIFGFQFLNYSKKQELVQKYMKYQKNNTELLEPAVDSINLREHKDETYWGDEQVPESTVPFEGPLSIVGVSNDVEQHYSNEYDFLSFNDKNCFVEDPEREHLIYKRRNYWTEQDKNKFYELFMEIPHQFRKISEHFPGKNAKDMIEFYYMTKTTFDFDSFRAATMDKKQLAARKKKVITEGPIKRH